MGKSRGSFLVVLNQVAELYGSEMAPMVPFDNPRSGGNCRDHGPEGPVPGENRLVERQAGEQSQHGQDERVPGIPRRSLVRGDAQFRTPPGIELSRRERFGIQITCHIKKTIIKRTQERKRRNG
jgi:hypothetical protein